MADVHVKLRRWASNARNDPASRVIVIDDAVKHVLIVVVVVLGVEVSRLTISEMIVGMRTREAQRGEERRKNVEDYKHRSIKQQVQQDTRPN